MLGTVNLIVDAKLYLSSTIANKAVILTYGQAPSAKGFSWTTTEPLLILYNVHQCRMLLGHQENSLRFDADYYQVYRLANKHIKSCGNLIAALALYYN
jgi:hypothetical protein